MSRFRYGLVFTLALVAGGLVVAAWFRYPGKAPGKQPAGNCRGDLWRHVYRAERLRVIEPCTAVDGRVVSLGRGSDGDLHIDLDPEQRSVLNLMNATHGHGHLVVEVICEHAAARGDPATACAGYTSQVAVPRIGDRVRVIGAYVTDVENGWNELHPVTRIETLR